MGRTLGVAVLLLGLTGTVRADDGPIIHVVRHIEDLTLEEAIRTTAVHGDLMVEVERDVAKTRVTLTLDDTLIEALRAIAAAGGAYLWQLEDGRYAVRRECPPTAAAVPRDAPDDAPEDAPEDAPAATGNLERPAWMTEVDDRLHTLEFEGAFKNVPLEALLAEFAKQARAPIDLDPDVLRTRSVRQRRVSFQNPLPDPITLWEALTLFGAGHDLSHELRWGGVFVGTSIRLAALPDKVFVVGTVDAPTSLRKALDACISLRPKRRSVLRAVQDLAKESKVGIVFRPAAKKRAGRAKVGLGLDRRRLEDALSLLLVPAGLALAIDEGELVVITR